jgi:hypothetical protein
MAEDEGVSPCHRQLHKEVFLNTLSFVEGESRGSSDTFKGGRRVK